MTRTSTSKAAVAKPAKATAAKPGAAVARKKAVAKTPAAAPQANGTGKPAAAPVKKAANPATEAKEKPRKAKLVRDSFTMPEAEYAVLGDVKKACLKAGIAVKKSELLRVGVALIRQLDTARLKEVLASLPALKAGRPKKSK
jgi:hypothetical protein